MWGRKTITVILPVDKDSKLLESVIREFDGIGYIDEILVLWDKKLVEDERIKNTRAQIIPTQSVIKAIKNVLRENKADLIAIADSDGSFLAKDVLKLLAYSDDFDTVFGSRTHIPLSGEKTGMKFLIRLMNASLGKLINILFFSAKLTDVGCTFRITNKKGWSQVVKNCSFNNWFFFSQWIIYASKNKVRFIQIPVNYSVEDVKSPQNGLFYQTIRSLWVFFYAWKVRLFS